MREYSRLKAFYYKNINNKVFSVDTDAQTNVTWECVIRQKEKIKIHPKMKDSDGVYFNKFWFDSVYQLIITIVNKQYENFNTKIRHLRILSRWMLHPASFGENIYSLPCYYWYEDVAKKLIKQCIYDSYLLVPRYYRNEENMHIVWIRSLFPYILDEKWWKIKKQEFGRVVIHNSTIWRILLPTPYEDWIKCDVSRYLIAAYCERYGIQKQDIPVYLR